MAAVTQQPLVKCALGSSGAARALGPDSQAVFARPCSRVAGVDRVFVVCDNQTGGVPSHQETARRSRGHRRPGRPVRFWDGDGPVDLTDWVAQERPSCLIIIFPRSDGGGTEPGTGLVPQVAECCERSGGGGPAGPVAAGAPTPLRNSSQRGSREDAARSVAHARGGACIADNRAP